MSTPRKSMDERLRESASRPKLRVVGERRPDETGMLPMSPLGELREPPPEEIGATAFFRVPVPGGERARRGIGLPPAIQPGMPPVSAPPAAPVIAPAPRGEARSRAPEAGARLVDARPFAGPVLVSGPVGPVDVPVPPAGDEGRIRSARVLAILSLVFLLVSALLLATALVVLGARSVAQPAPTPGGVATPIPSPSDARDLAALEELDPPDDAGTAPPADSSPGRPHPVPGDRGANGLGGKKTTRTPDALTVRFSGAPLPTLVEVTCGAVRQRAPLVGGAATISGLPAATECRLFPKGIVVATTVPVQAGGTYDCHIEGTTTTCR